MSFTSIVKRIEKINQKHKEIELRYNRRGKTCPRQDDLLREEQEDKHIYGTSITTKVTLTLNYCICSSKDHKKCWKKQDHVPQLIKERKVQKEYARLRCRVEIQKGRRVQPNQLLIIDSSITFCLRRTSLIRII